jgi:hypothetical protein
MGSLITAVLLAFAFARFRAHRRATMAVRIRRDRVTLRSVARLLDVEPTQLGAVLGVSDAELREWHASGIPAVSRVVVMQVLESAAALRRELSAPVTRRLIELQALRRSARVDAKRARGDLSCYTPAIRIRT